MRLSLFSCCGSFSLRAVLTGWRVLDNCQCLGFFPIAESFGSIACCVRLRKRSVRFVKCFACARCRVLLVCPSHVRRVLVVFLGHGTGVAFSVVFPNFGLGGRLEAK